jgi:glycosyltransferase involved in cell wall biosynthesis
MQTGSFKVVVSHPGRQHSHQLALALAAEEMLAAYLTGVPAHPFAAGRWGRPFIARYAEAYAIPLDPKLTRHCFVSPFVRRIASRIGTSAARVDWTHRADSWFDRWAARQLAASGAGLVVAYENAALHTFREAKRRGMTTVLDASSVHHRFQDQCFAPMESPAVHHRITRRKDEELDLADAVLTVSSLARQTYVDAGVRPSLVFANPVGVDTDLFKPIDKQVTSGGDGPPRLIRFVYVGSAATLKGLDVLQQAVNALRVAGRSFELTLVGPEASSLNVSHDAGIRFSGRLSHSQLAQELPRHDVLILPSYFDSFGMVVAEAMACGLPAIVTERVGAREMIRQDANGLVIPAGDPTALAEALRWFIDHPSLLPAMSHDARLAAERYSWSAYGRRAVELLTSIQNRPLSVDPIGGAVA